MVALPPSGQTHCRLALSCSLRVGTPAASTRIYLHFANLLPGTHTHRALRSLFNAPHPRPHVAAVTCVWNPLQGGGALLNHFRPLHRRLPTYCKQLARETHGTASPQSTATLSSSAPVCTTLSSWFPTTLGSSSLPLCSTCAPSRIRPRHARGRGCVGGNSLSNTPHFWRLIFRRLILKTHPVLPALDAILNGLDLQDGSSY